MPENEGATKESSTTQTIKSTTSENVSERSGNGDLDNMTPEERAQWEQQQKQGERRTTFNNPSKNR